MLREPLPAASGGQIRPLRRLLAMPVRRSSRCPPTEAVTASSRSGITAPRLRYRVMGVMLTPLPKVADGLRDGGAIEEASWRR